MRYLPIVLLAASLARGHSGVRVEVVEALLALLGAGVTPVVPSRGSVGASVPEGIPFGNFHVVERFVPVAPNRIHYYVTITDPKTWTRPWTVAFPLTRDPGYTMYEYACHEGNYALRNILSGVRASESAR